jgi:hypothetical protein
VDLDNRAFLQANLPEGRVEQRARDAVRILTPLVAELSSDKP